MQAVNTQELSSLDTIYIATKNEGKRQEFEKLLRPLQATVLSLPEGLPTAPETGDTFASNAMQKAMFYSRFCAGWVIADDSGICVDALGGAPGVYSARYAGMSASDEENNQKLLRELRCRLQDAKYSTDVPAEFNRNAQFVCALARVHRDLDDSSLCVEGRLDGIVLQEKRGHNGFGYDPLFYVPQLGKTLAELQAIDKNRFSHRAKAVQLLLQAWRDRPCE